MLVTRAIDQALSAKEKWSRTSLHDRAAIFYRAAALIQHEYRNQMMAATMLGQGKNAYQADIDCVAEVMPLMRLAMLCTYFMQSIDFLKTFPALAAQLYKAQPPFNAPGVWK